MYRITLKNGKVLNGLESDGYNFISKEEVSPEFFEGNLRGIKIEFIGDKDAVREAMLEPKTYDMLKLMYCRKIFGYEGTYIAFEEYSDQELREMKTNARLDYLEMMIEPDEAVIEGGGE